MNKPLIIKTRPALLAHLAEVRDAGKTIGLVPTMGALHDGHLALVRAAALQHNHVILTIFVNPTQFGPQEDFGRYPRDIERDAALLSTVQCDVVFAPSVDEVYAGNCSTRVIESEISTYMEGQIRPHHFSGVATIVTYLLCTIRPDASYFGEKDYQQLMVISRATRDLGLPAEILAVPTVRARDGLALSSRNAYLNEAQRAIGPVLARTLHEAAEQLKSGETVVSVEARAREQLTLAGFDPVNYVEVRAAADLTRLGPGPIDRSARIFGAAALGAIRLTDNVSI